MPPLARPSQSRPSWLPRRLCAALAGVAALAAAPAGAVGPFDFLVGG